MEKPRKEAVMRAIIQSGGMEIRDVDGGEEAYLYSTRNRGPGYLDIKGRVGWADVFELMLDVMADMVIESEIVFDLVVGMMTGGALPGFRLTQLIRKRTGKNIAYIYQRGARKVGGHKELDTGDRNNPNITAGARTLIVEELVNFAGTTTNGALYERNEKLRVVDDAATILFYQNPFAIERLRVNNINLHWVIGLRDDLLPFVEKEKLFPKKLTDQYWEFLNDPKAWNLNRGFEFYATTE